MSDIVMPGTFRLADVFGKAFSIYGRRIVPLVVLSVTALIPYYIAVTLFMIGMTTMRWDAGTFSVAQAGLSVLDVVTRSFISGAVTYGVIQEIRGRPLSVSDSFGAALRRLPPMLGIWLVFAAVRFLGETMLSAPVRLADAEGVDAFSIAGALAAAAILAGTYLAACMVYVAMPLCVAEKAGVFTCISRSRFLTKGYRWQLFGVLLLIPVVTLVLWAIVRDVFTMTGFIGLTIAIQVLTAFISAFTGVLIGVLYYDLRIAKEGVDVNRVAGVFD